MTYTLTNEEKATLRETQRILKKMKGDQEVVTLVDSRGDKFFMEGATINDIALKLYLMEYFNRVE